jgi:hypothetical protein
MSGFQMELNDYPHFDLIEDGRLCSTGQHCPGFLRLLYDALIHLGYHEDAPVYRCRLSRVHDLDRCEVSVTITFDHAGGRPLDFLKTFKLDFYCGYLNKLFEDFSNVKLLEIDLNNSNLKQYFKRKTFKMINRNKVWKFETKFRSFQKAKST